MVNSGIRNPKNQIMELPPGFRFHPTDEELITHYLSKKVAGNSLSSPVIGELDLNRLEPWDLPSSSKLGEEWYFFCVRDRKYPTGQRTNRATESGYWKATGKDKEIHRRKIVVGMKKTLVFYKGRAPKGEKTNWVMHEYRLEGKQPKENDWMMCRIFYRSCSGQKDMALIKMRSEEISSAADVPLVDDHYSNKSSSAFDEKIHVTCFSNPFLEDQKGYEEPLANTYDSTFFSNFNASWSSLNTSKKPRKGFMPIIQSPPDLVILQEQCVSPTVNGKGGIIGVPDEIWPSSNLQSDTYASAANSDHVEGCILNDQEGFPVQNQFLHLDDWSLNQ